MNIKQFKEGDYITRNKPCGYKGDDSSYCGDRMIFIAVDEESRIIFLLNLEMRDVIELSYARDAWDEGWIYYPKSLWEKAKVKLQELINNKDE